MADDHPAVLVNITRQPSGNTVAVADAVDKELDQLKRPDYVSIAQYVHEMSTCPASHFLEQVEDALTKLALKFKDLPAAPDAASIREGLQRLARSADWTVHLHRTDRPPQTALIALYADMSGA